MDTLFVYSKGQTEVNLAGRRIAVVDGAVGIDGKTGWVSVVGVHYPCISISHQCPGGVVALCNVRRQFRIASTFTV